MLPNRYLAQLNIARLLAPIDDPLIAGFVAKLDEINQLAEQSEGFVWRLKDEENNATNYRPFDDEKIIVNMSVWDSVESLKQFTYKTAHAEIMKHRNQWFEKHIEPYMVLWWCGEIPDVEEAKKRLAHLKTHGETEFAFTFRKIF